MNLILSFWLLQPVHYDARWFIFFEGQGILEFRKTYIRYSCSLCVSLSLSLLSCEGIRKQVWQRLWGCGACTLFRRVTRFDRKAFTTRNAEGQVGAVLKKKKWRRSGGITWCCTFELWRQKTWNTLLEQKNLDCAIVREEKTWRRTSSRKILGSTHSPKKTSGGALFKEKILDGALILKQINVGWPDPDPSPEPRRCLHRSSPLPLWTDPATKRR